MSAPRKFDSKTRERAVRMYADRLGDGESKLAARRRVGELLGINPATLRNWVEAAERAARPVEPSGLSLAEENARLRRRTPSCAGRMRS